MTALLKGALVELMPTFLVSLPNLIVFQYNPETMTHTWAQPQPLADPGTDSGNPLAVKGMPGESFSFTPLAGRRRGHRPRRRGPGWHRAGDRRLRATGGAGDAALSDRLQRIEPARHGVGRPEPGRSRLQHLSAQPDQRGRNQDRPRLDGTGGALSSGGQAASFRSGSPA